MVLNMTKCYMPYCNGEAKFKITNAEQHPKKYNGKMICEDCNRARTLLKQEPWGEKDE